MRGTGRCVATSVVALAASLVLGSPASAADSYVVHGTTRLDDQTFLTYVPCAGFFASGATVPGLRINRGPEAAPLGRRSFGLAMKGAGTAAGVVRHTTSLGLLGDVAMSVNPAQATKGVAYVWYVSPDLAAGQAWLGRADLAAARGWQRVDVSAATFTWRVYDLASRRPLGEPARALLPDFVAGHGDGPGYVVAGFGCDGTSFNIDAVGYGPSTYDLEGFVATTSIEAERAVVGQPVTVRGWSERATGQRLGDPLVLERLVPGTSKWEPVTGPIFAGPDAVVRATVEPDVPTYFRWRMADSEYADANVSEPVRVDSVVRVEPGGDPTPTPTPTPTPNSGPAPSPAQTQTPSPSPSPTSGQTPSPSQTQAPTQTQTPEPTP